MTDINRDKELVIVARGNEQLSCEATVVQRIPYFESIISGRWSYNEGIRIDANISTLRAFLAFAASNFQNPYLMLAKLPRESNVKEIMNLSDYFLKPLPVIDNLEKLEKLESLLKDIRRQEIQKVERHCFQLDSAPDRLGARNAAALLVFSLVKGALNIDDKDIRQRAINDILFIVSNPEIFGPRLRTHAWNSLESFVVLTKDQKKRFEEWTNSNKLKFEFNKEGDIFDNSRGSDTDGECSTGSLHGYYDSADECGY